MELIQHPASSVEDLVARLENILSLAKEGKITDYLMVYLDKDGPGFSHSYRMDKQLKILGLLNVMAVQFASHQFVMTGEEPE